MQPVHFLENMLSLQDGSNLAEKNYFWNFFVDLTQQKADLKFPYGAKFLLIQISTIFVKMLQQKM